MNNKTEITRDKIYGRLIYDYFGGVSVFFLTDKNINKINKLFPTKQIFEACFDPKRRLSDSYIQCIPSKDYKQIIAIGYVIYCYPYNYRANIDVKDIFNEEELKMLEEEALKILKEREEIEDDEF